MTWLRCSYCDADYIAGTVLCPECMGTDLRPIADVPEELPADIANNSSRIPALRTSFHWEDMAHPVQVVNRRVPLPWLRSRSR